tara:strand:+ start:380 stop:484 length:105 start_codon:yes stop_codon:yes gene_type:complete
VIVESGKKKKRKKRKKEDGELKIHRQDEGLYTCA